MALNNKKTNNNNNRNNHQQQAVLVNIEDTTKANLDSTPTRKTRMAQENKVRIRI